MKTHRRQMICRHEGCNVAVKADSTAGVCAQHMHQEACGCVACGGQNAVKEYKRSVTLPPMPWEMQNA